MNKTGDRAAVDSLVGFLRLLEDGLLVGLFTLMVGMAVTQIVLRNLMGGGIVWGEILVRVLVLWIGLVGAMVASRKGKHISIDVVNRYLPPRAKEIARALVELFTALICAIAAFYSLRFVLADFEDGGLAFALVPVWLCESVIPVAFSVIALRHFLSFLINIRNLVKPTS
jgi:TRAP-type C4-dicarboxylate transport system permease small subunit